jgi:DNA repair protein RecO (recombination protein O)
MEERASGIILRTRLLTETSLIVHLLSRDQGRIAFVAKGARRPKSPFTGKLDLFYEVNVSFSRSRKSELHNLREVSLLETHAALRRDLSRLNAAAYCAVLIELATETETPVPEYYEFAREVLHRLGRSAPTIALVFALELKFLQLFGAAPALETLSSAAAQLVAAYGSVPLDAADKLPLDAALRRELDPLLRRGIGTALERLPPQRERLLQSLRSPH